MSDSTVLSCVSAGETFGEVLRVREVPGFLLRESRYPAGAELPSHRHAGFYFAYTVRGEMVERTPQGVRRHPAASLHFHPSGEPHSGRIGADGLTSLSIIPSPRLAARLGAKHDVMEGPRAALLSGLAARCRREVHATDGASDLALESLGLELLARWMRLGSDARGPRWLAETRDYLHAHRDRRVRLGELAGLAGVHEVYLVRAFRRRFGVTPGAYQRRLRVEEARRVLVQEPGLPLVDVALGAGFANQAHFGRVFRALTGESPGAYRRARAGG
jgi:AraC family transcriptional regulator